MSTQMSMTAMRLAKIFAGLGLFASVAPASAANGQDAEYVSLGSSFGAGPGVTHAADGSPPVCARSNDNYAHLYARSSNVSLRDETCSGAATKDVLHASAGKPAQIDAVGPTTKLVTVTVGGNDVYYLGNLMGQSCLRSPASVPSSWKKLGVCTVKTTAEVEEKFGGLEASMRAIVAGIKTRAPDARIIFVNYIRILPQNGSCAKLPLTTAQLNAGRKTAARVEAITRKVTAETGVDLLDAATMSHGHDICSAKPWATGFVFSPNVQQYGLVPYHPTLPAMTAIARKIGEMQTR